MKRRYRTADQNWVRQRNLAIVLNYLWEEHGPISRSQLTGISGLNKTTVGTLLTQLQDWAFVREVGLVGQRPGRPGVLLDLNSEGGRVIGAEIGVGFVSVIVADLKANVLWRRQVETPGETHPSDKPETAVLAQVEQLVAQAIQKATASGVRLLGIGLGVPGMVDQATGTLLFAPNLGWANVPLRERWARLFQVPVIVENEANAAALGEHMLGVARQVDNFVYLSAGVGLGGGVVINGDLYGGVGGFAGEVGHMTLEPSGPVCKCGNRGCWETLIGPTAIVQRAREAAMAGTAPQLLAAVHGQVQAIQMPQVLLAAAQGECAVLQVFSEVGRYLGIGIANLLNAFNPSLVVLGGMLSLAEPYILPRAQEEVDRRALTISRRGVQIVVSAFRFDACVMGGVSLILREVLSNPAGWQPAPVGPPPATLMLAASAL